MIRLSRGNSKLKGTSTAAFLIFNLPAVVTCPQSTPECRRLCYARKAERIYPSVLPSRQRHLEVVNSPSFIDDMTEAIKKEISKPFYKGKKIYFRWHESGDFFSLEYIFAAHVIASRFKEITFLAYTKSVDLFTDHLFYYDRLPSNFRVRFSEWEDTPFNELMKGRNLFPTFTAYPKGKVPDHVFKCQGDCTHCKMCYDSNMDIGIEIH